jgi:hypothetical protein
MPISIADIINMAAPAITLAMDKPYRFAQVREIADSPQSVFSLYAINSFHSVSVAWTRYQEAALLTERQRIDFAKNLIERAINSLDAHIQDQERLNNLPQAQQEYRYNPHMDWSPIEVSIPINGAATPAAAQIEDEVRDVDFGED